ncbi:hypothetical protein IWQ60_000069 [Tieghemiomyces parasiticus]|uniref:Mtf2-like C-terminal domain-containing protein n=1 Tax=Tieghemiomyces parasiticus TaxID=78921 RepID=A0A9W8E337_9FUNG|nr:hypothetical protein IWQ60_000069 [Tieghemiomyces parasiticus]
MSRFTYFTARYATSIRPTLRTAAARKSWRSLSMAPSARFVAGAVHANQGPIHSTSSPSKLPPSSPPPLDSAAGDPVDSHLSPLEKYLVQLLEQSGGDGSKKGVSHPLSTPTAPQLQATSAASRTAGSPPALTQSQVRADDWSPGSMDDIALADFANALDDHVAAATTGRRSMTRSDDGEYDGVVAASDTEMAQWFASDPLANPSETDYTSLNGRTTATTTATHISTFPAGTGSTPLGHFMDTMLRMDAIETWLSQLAKSSTNLEFQRHLAELFALNQESTQATANPSATGGGGGLNLPERQSHIRPPKLSARLITGCLKQCQRTGLLNYILVIMDQIRQLGWSTYITLVTTEVYNTLLSILWESRTAAAWPRPLPATGLILRYLDEMLSYGTLANDQTREIMQRVLHDIDLEVPNVRLANQMKLQLYERLTRLGIA